MATKKKVTKTKTVTREQLEYIVWKPIKDYEGYYEVSNTGLVRGIFRILYGKNGKKKTNQERLMSFKFDKDGYVEVSLTKNGYSKSIRVHRLVANAFIPNPKNKPIPNHLNGIRNDNRVSNLEWSTQSENKLHSFRVLGYEMPNKKPVNQFSLYGELIKEWRSITEAANSLKMYREGIRDSANGKQLTYNIFIWKYAS